MNKTLLVLVNGYEKNWAAIEYASWLAAQTGKTLRLEGIVENPAKKGSVDALLARASQYLGQKGLAHSVETHLGNLDKTASQLSEKFPHAIFVAGNMGRSPLQKLISGGSFRNLMEAVRSPMLFVPAASIPVKKVLICMGGLKYALTAEHLGLQLAKEMDAQVTLLTVVPPIDLDYPEARIIREQWQTLAETDTEPGRNLRNALATAQGLGVEANVRARNGNIVEEILDEIKTGQYQLTCMGSSFSAHGLRHMMTANITAEIAESRLCPVLSARYDADE
jgi:nucleotide-binding universal stress UspA family protein